MGLYFGKNRSLDSEKHCKQKGCKKVNTTKYLKPKQRDKKGNNGAMKIGRIKFRRIPL